MIRYELLNGVTLAYIGDSYYELYIRKYLIDQKLTKVNDLHQLAIKYVSAKAQAHVIEQLSKREFFSREEEDIVKRGRNGKVNQKRVHTDLATYKTSTGFEALIGYLYLMGKTERAEEIMLEAIKIIENGD